MDATLFLFDLDGQPMLTIAAWAFLPGLLLILPGSAAAVTHGACSLARRQWAKLSGGRRPAPADRHREAFLL